MDIPNPGKPEPKRVAHGDAGIAEKYASHPFFPRVSAPPREEFLSCFDII